MSRGGPEADRPPPPPPGWDAPAPRWAPPVTSVLSRWQLATLALAGTGACLYVAVVDPNTSSAYPQCPLRQLTGWDCAGCGGLRATHALLNGDLGRAIDHNVLVVLLAPLAVYGIVQVLAAQRGRKLPSVRYRSWMTAAFLGVIVAFSVLRNLAWGPFTYLHSDPS